MSDDRHAPPKKKTKGDDDEEEEDLVISVSFSRSSFRFEIFEFNGSAALSLLGPKHLEPYFSIKNACLNSGTSTTNTHETINKVYDSSNAQMI